VLTESLHDKEVSKEFQSRAFGSHHTSSLKDTGPRGAAAFALGKIGPEAKTSVPALAELLGDEGQEIRAIAAKALAGIGAEAKAATPRLIKALSDECQPVRLEACVALAEIGPDAKAAVPAITGLLHRFGGHNT